MSPRLLLSLLVAIILMSMFNPLTILAEDLNTEEPAEFIPPYIWPPDFFGNINVREEGGITSFGFAYEIWEYPNHYVFLIKRATLCCAEGQIAYPKVSITAFNEEAQKTLSNTSDDCELLSQEYGTDLWSIEFEPLTVAKQSYYGSWRFYDTDIMNRWHQHYYRLFVPETEGLVHFIIDPVPTPTPTLTPTMVPTAMPTSTPIPIGVAYLPLCKK